jgi:hypothetical protein
MFKDDLPRIFVTLWFRHNEQHVINGGKPYQNERGDLVCNLHGCTHSFAADVVRGPKVAEQNMLSHRSSQENAKYHTSHLLYVYDLPHYLVYKTDIVISVNAIIPTANLT